MTVSKTTLAIGATWTLLLGMIIGQFTLPAKVVERDRIVTTDREVESSWHAYVGHTETRSETKVQWQTVTKWEKDGSVTQTVQAAQESTQATKTDVNEQESKTREVVKYQEVVHEKIVEAKKPDWLLGAGAGLDGKRELVYQGEVSRRILGPVFVGVWGQYPVAAGVGVRLLF